MPQLRPSRSRPHEVAPSKFSHHAREAASEQRESEQGGGVIQRSFQESLVLDHLDLAAAIAARYSSRTHDFDDVR